MSQLDTGAHSPDDLAAIYGRRFDREADYRNRVWQVLVRRFFGQYIPPQGAVLDLGCGYGQFINNVQAARKFAMDLNPRTRDFLNPDIQFVQQDCSAAWELAPESLDVVFTSNFFEHLPTKDSLARTLGQAHRALRSGGRLIAIGPNIRHVPGAYWDFWDHYLPLTERSLQEVLELQGFQMERVVDRFLPYTMIGATQYPPFLIGLYVRMPFAWPLRGKQFLVVARKP